MPYWNPTELKVDIDNIPILPGDVLERIDWQDGWEPWRYHICFTRGLGELIEVRDLNANNVGMCDVGLNGNVKNIGHITKVYNKLESSIEWESDDWGYYFRIYDPLSSYDYYCIKEQELKDPKTIENNKNLRKLNNFPDDWKLIR